jgi:hypothetical protein
MREIQLDQEDVKQKIGHGLAARNIARSGERFGMASEPILPARSLLLVVGQQL